MGGDIEWGTCPFCGKDSSLERTYFYYNIKCECCGNKNGWHFEIIKHCNKCPAPIPTHVHLFIRAMDGRLYKANISNIWPIEIRGQFIIDSPIITK